MNERMQQEMERTIKLLQAMMPEQRAKPGRGAHRPQSPGQETAVRKARSPLLRRGAAVTLAAMVALCLVGAAYAIVSSSWFKAYFTDRAGEPLSEKQYQFIEETSVGIGQSVTADGYTVTVDSAICDAQNLLLVVLVEGPEGVKLDFDPTEGSCAFQEVRCQTTGSQPQTGSLNSFSRSWSNLNDGDGKDNTVTLLMWEQRVMSPSNCQVYTDGEPWQVQLSDLFLRTGEYFSEVEILAHGSWNFQFPLSALVGEVEMIDTPVLCTAQSGGEGAPKEPAAVLVDSFVLRPFGATCTYSFPPGPRPVSVDILDVSLMMKDGSIVTARPKSGGGTGAIGANGGTMSYTFNAPVILDEVQYLILPDNVLVPFPEQ